MNKDKEKWNTIKHQLDDIVALLEEGLSEIEVAERMGIELEEWYRCKKTYPEFGEAVANIGVEYAKKINQSIWELAIGSKQKETIRRTKTYPNGDVEVTETVIERSMPPDIEACREVLNILSNIIDGDYNEQILNAYSKDKVRSIRKNVKAKAFKRC